MTPSLINLAASEEQITPKCPRCKETNTHKIPSTPKYQKVLDRNFTHWCLLCLEKDSSHFCFNPAIPICPSCKGNNIQEETDPSRLWKWACLDCKKKTHFWNQDSYKDQWCFEEEREKEQSMSQSKFMFADLDRPYATLGKGRYKTLSGRGATYGQALCDLYLKQVRFDMRCLLGCNRMPQSITDRRLRNGAKQ